VKKRDSLHHNSKSENTYQYLINLSREAKNFKWRSPNESNVIWSDIREEYKEEFENVFSINTFTPPSTPLQGFLSVRPQSPSLFMFDDESIDGDMYRSGLYNNESSLSVVSDKNSVTSKKNGPLFISTNKFAHNRNKSHSFRNAISPESVSSLRSPSIISFGQTNSKIVNNQNCDTIKVDIDGVDAPALGNQEVNGSNQSTNTTGYNRSLSDGDLSAYLKGFSNLKYSLKIAKNACNKELKKIIKILYAYIEEEILLQRRQMADNIDGGVTSETSLNQEYNNIRVTTPVSNTNSNSIQLFSTKYQSDNEDNISAYSLPSSLANSSTQKQNISEESVKKNDDTQIQNSADHIVSTSSLTSNKNPTEYYNNRKPSIAMSVVSQTSSSYKAPPYNNLRNNSIDNSSLRRKDSVNSEIDYGSRARSRTSQKSINEDSIESLLTSYKDTSPLVEALVNAIFIAQTIIDMDVGDLITTGMCRSIIEEIQSLQILWNKNPSWPGKTYLVRMLMNFASVARLVEHLEADARIWNYSNPSKAIKDRSNKNSISSSSGTPMASYMKQHHLNSAGSRRDSFSSFATSESEYAMDDDDYYDDDLYNDYDSEYNQYHGKQKPSDGTSEHRKYRHQRQESWSLLELREAAIESQSLNVLIEMGLDGKILYVSPVCYTVFAYEPNEILGTTVPPFLPPNSEDANVFKNAMKCLLADNNANFAMEINYKACRGDGRWLEMEGKGMLMTDRLTKTKKSAVWVTRPTRLIGEGWEEVLSSSSESGSVRSQTPELPYDPSSQSISSVGGVSSDIPPLPTNYAGNNYNSLPPTQHQKIKQIQNNVTESKNSPLSEHSFSIIDFPELEHKEEKEGEVEERPTHRLSVIEARTHKKSPLSITSEDMFMSDDEDKEERVEGLEEGLEEESEEEVEVEEISVKPVGEGDEIEDVESMMDITPAGDKIPEEEVVIDDNEMDEMEDEGEITPNEDNMSDISYHGENLVLCHICERTVPVILFEQHSEICAEMNRTEMDIHLTDEELVNAKNQFNERINFIDQEIVREKNMTIHLLNNAMPLNDYQKQEQKSYINYLLKLKGIAQQYIDYIDKGLDLPIEEFSMMYENDYLNEIHRNDTATYSDDQIGKLKSALENVDIVDTTEKEEDENEIEMEKDEVEKNQEQSVTIGDSNDNNNNNNNNNNNSNNSNNNNSSNSNSNNNNNNSSSGNRDSLLDKRVSQSSQGKKELLFFAKVDRRTSKDQVTDGQDFSNEDSENDDNTENIEIYAIHPSPTDDECSIFSENKSSINVGNIDSTADLTTKLKFIKEWKGTPEEEFYPSPSSKQNNNNERLTVTNPNSSELSIMDDSSVLGLGLGLYHLCSDVEAIVKGKAENVEKLQISSARFHESMINEETMKSDMLMTDLENSNMEATSSIFNSEEGINDESRAQSDDEDQEDIPDDGNESVINDVMKNDLTGENDSLIQSDTEVGEEDFPCSSDDEDDHDLLWAENLNNSNNITPTQQQHLSSFITKPHLDHESISFNKQKSSLLFDESTNDSPRKNKPTNLFINTKNNKEHRSFLESLADFIHFSKPSSSFKDYNPLPNSRIVEMNEHNNSSLSLSKTNSQDFLTTPTLSNTNSTNNIISNNNSNNNNINSNKSPIMVKHSKPKSTNTPVWHPLENESVFIPSLIASPKLSRIRSLDNPNTLSPKISISSIPSSPLTTNNIPRSVPSIKDFEIIKPISKGAFGAVYLAKKKVTGDYFAIKVLKKADMIAKNQVKNIRAERLILSQLDSPYVVKLYFSFQSHDNLYLVMEYLNGGDCAALIKAIGQLDEKWAKQYISEVTLGLEFLHSRGIIHRDLKPGKKELFIYLYSIMF